MAQAKSVIAKLSFEEALHELDSIVRNLESGSISLEDAIAQYERGASLEAQCRAKLNDARMRVEKITMSKEGEPRLAPIDEAG